jgi:hypothetical protein
MHWLGWATKLITIKTSTDRRHGLALPSGFVPRARLAVTGELLGRKGEPKEPQMRRALIIATVVSGLSAERNNPIPQIELGRSLDRLCLDARTGFC